jgi:hypothetical protein
VAPPETPSSSLPDRPRLPAHVAEGLLARAAAIRRDSGELRRVAQVVCKESRDLVRELKRLRAERVTLGRPQAGMARCPPSEPSVAASPDAA